MANVNCLVSLDGFLQPTIIYMHFVLCRPGPERVFFCMEPFVRLMSLEAYEAFLKWDADFFKEAGAKMAELVKSGVHTRPIHFPTLLQLLELKR